MNYKHKAGFTLIELMVVIVIIGVLASLAIPRFTEASDKAKMVEAPRIIASFESGYTAALAENGVIRDESEIIFDLPTDSRWFAYTFEKAHTADPDDEDDRDILEGIKATAKSNIGKFAKGAYVATRYIPIVEKFCHASDLPNETNRLVPNFEAVNEADCHP